MIRLFSACISWFPFAGEFITGRVIKAMNNNWHPECFRCELCDVTLADLGFVKNAGRYEGAGGQSFISVLSIQL